MTNFCGAKILKEKLGFSHLFFLNYFGVFPFLCRLSRCQRLPKSQKCRKFSLFWQNTWILRPFRDPASNYLAKYIFRENVLNLNVCLFTSRFVILPHKRSDKNSDEMSYCCCTSSSRLSTLDIRRAQQWNSNLYYALIILKIGKIGKNGKKLSKCWQLPVKHWKC